MAETESPLAFLLTTPYASRYPRKLVEGFPHVARRIAELWDDKDKLGEYFTELMVSKRPNRRGFPPEVGAEIVYLSMAYDLHGPVRPHRASGPELTTAARDDAWDYERAVAELERLDIPITMAQFVRALEAGDQHLCSLFLHAGFDIDSRDAPMDSADDRLLHDRGRSPRADPARRQRGCDGRRRLRTPLHWASVNGYQKVGEVLVRRQAEVNADEQRRHHAAAAGRGAATWASCAC